MPQRDFPPIEESAEQLKDLLTCEQSAKRHVHRLTERIRAFGKDQRL